MQKIGLTITIIFIAFLLVGCEESEGSKQNRKLEEKAINACIDLGGVPILQYGELKTCEFNNN